MRILISGATGFIGKNLRSRLQIKYEVFCPSSIELNLIDESSVQTFFCHNNFDMVIHCASWDATWNSRKDPSRILDHNLRMFQNLVRQSNHYIRLISLGSGAEYSKPDLIPCAPESFFDTHIPLDPYGFSKYLISKYIDNLPYATNLRLFGVFGKYEDWRTRFISNVICRALYDLPIEIIQDVAFDFLYIEDLLDIIEWFLEHKPGERGFNVCSGRVFYLSELAKMVLKVLNKDLPINIMQNGLGIEYSGDNSRLKSEIKIIRITPIMEAIQDLSVWYQEHINQIPFEEIRENRRVKISLKEMNDE